MTELELRKELGLGLRHQRVERGLSQAQLAAMIGRQRADISKIELGKVNATINSIAALCIALQTDFWVVARHGAQGRLQGASPPANADGPHAG